MMSYWKVRYHLLIACIRVSPRAFMALHPVIIHIERWLAVWKDARRHICIAE